MRLEQIADIQRMSPVEKTVTNDAEPNRRAKELRIFDQPVVAQFPSRSRGRRQLFDLLEKRIEHFTAVNLDERRKPDPFGQDKPGDRRAVSALSMVESPNDALERMAGFYARILFALWRNKTCQSAPRRKRGQVRRSWLA